MADLRTGELQHVAAIDLGSRRKRHFPAGADQLAQVDAAKFSVSIRLNELEQGLARDGLVGHDHVEHLCGDIEQFRCVDLFTNGFRGLQDEFAPADQNDDVAFGKDGVRLGVERFAVALNP